ncbi:prepilin peptidase [Bacillota bacterium LX-D]|nr:prepilin peptidase [Bacillota bacterium LX-D]
MSCVYLIVFFLGLIMGSFLALCITRIPQNQSILFPPSHCEKCNASLKPCELIPVLSWLFLKGKCRYCQSPIPMENTLVEILTGILFMAAVYFLGLSYQLLPYLGLICVLIVISFIDYKHYLIPDSVLLVGLSIGLVINVFYPFINWVNGAIGILAGGGLLYFLAVVSKGGMGGGDIKLAALLGFYLGWRKILLALFVATFLATIAGGFLILTKQKSLKDYIPFGPFLSIGTTLIIFLGDQFLIWYLTIII